MSWWVVETAGAWSVQNDPATTVAQYIREFGVPPQAGPFGSYNAGNNWLTAHGHVNSAPIGGPPGGSSGGGPSPPPPAPPGGPKPPRGPLGKRGQRMTGLLLAKIAKRYKGAGYVYGGNASAVGVWDCSSFVSYCLHQAGLALPGGKWGDPGFPPNVHGPVVISYADWQGATTVTMPEAGDLVCYVGLGVHGHIGIAISSTEMVSALDPTDGTKQTTIFAGSPGEPRIYRRINGLAGGVALASGPGANRNPPLVVIGVVAAMFGGVLLLGLAAVAGLGYGVSRMMRSK